MRNETHFLGKQSPHEGTTTVLLAGSCAIEYMRNETRLISVGVEWF
jgi:hypothetical protein